MINFSKDTNGVPILSRINIEELSEKFILEYNKDFFERPEATPILTICEHLKKNFDLNLVVNIDLGFSPEGYKYRGRFNISTTTIYIDKSLEVNDPRFNFTLAHEIGHFVLHREINCNILKEEENDEILDTNRQLILDHVKSNNPRDWLEWQANKFASSLLLPRKTVPMAVIEKQTELNITRRIGQIYLDNQKENKLNFYYISEYLYKIFETSKASIKLRLKELNLLIETDTGISPSSNKIVSARQAMVSMLKNI